MANVDYKAVLDDMPAVKWTRLNLFVNAVRKLAGVGIACIYDVKKDPPMQASSPAAKEQATADTTSGTLKVNLYWDQSMKFVVAMIPAPEIKVMRGRWSGGKSVPLTPHRALSDKQLSVLSRLKDLKENMLAFDMGVWGPFSDQRTAH